MIWMFLLMFLMTKTISAVMIFCGSGAVNLYIVFDVGSTVVRVRLFFDSPQCEDPREDFDWQDHHLGC